GDSLRCIALRGAGRDHSCNAMQCNAMQRIRAGIGASASAVGPELLLDLQYLGRTFLLPFPCCRHRVWRLDAYRRSRDRIRQGLAGCWGVRAWGGLPRRSAPGPHPPLPAPRAGALRGGAPHLVPPSSPRASPLVFPRGSGAVIEDVDGTRFLALTAGIAVTA